MANELTYSMELKLAFIQLVLPAVSGFGIDLSTKKFVFTEQTIGFSAEEAIDLGDLATLGIAWVWNTDPTNFLTIRTGTGSGKGGWKFLPDERFAWRFSSDVTAPFAIADTAAVKMRYCFFEV